MDAMHQTHTTRSMKMLNQAVRSNKKIIEPICRGAVFALALCLCALQLLVPSAYAEDSAQAPLTAPLASASAPDQESGLTADHHALPGFSSHMPLLVLELSGDTLAQDKDGYFLDAHIESFDGGQANALSDAPALSRDVSLRNMSDKTNGKGISQKSDYYLKLSGEESLLGLGGSSEYLLLGGMKDKSLIRNYIGYTLASSIMQEAVGSRLCELFIRTQDGEKYQGVYLLVKLGIDGDSVLFHRNERGEGIVINTYSTQNDPSSGYVSIPFMESTNWDDRLSEPIGQLSSAESMLYSTSSATFYKYADWFDVPSFISSFILGELTENYAGMLDAYYAYDPKTQKVAAVPIWNFEEAFDNQARDPAHPNQIKYQEAPYYELFFKSPQFVGEVQSFYLQARKKVLDEGAIDRLVDEAAAYVSPAVGRDWSRWNGYAGHRLAPLTKVPIDEEREEPVEPFARQTESFEAELLRIKYQLREHNLELAFSLTQFDFSEREISKEIVLNTNPTWLIVFLLVFFALVRFARRYGV